MRDLGYKIKDIEEYESPSGARSLHVYEKCLVIDDMGEGLDYMRSTKLGKIMYDFCEKNHIQLIATSNDSFLMDAVDLQCWNILQREGNRVYSISALNSPALFEKFRRTGLSNFDILSSNFLVNNSSDE